MSEKPGDKFTVKNTDGSTSEYTVMHPGTWALETARFAALPPPPPYERFDPAALSPIIFDETEYAWAVSGASCDLLDSTS